MAHGSQLTYLTVQAYDKHVDCVNGNHCRLQINKYVKLQQIANKQIYQIAANCNKTNISNCSQLQKDKYIKLQRSSMKSGQQRSGLPLVSEYSTLLFVF